MEWIQTTVGEYCPFIYGKGLPQSKRKQGDIKVYGSNGPVGTHTESYVQSPGIIIGRKGSVGEVHLSNEPFWPIDTAFYIASENLNELQFIYYLLKSLRLEAMNSDSAVPGLNRDNAHALPILIPQNLLDRQALGKWIAAFDDKITINQKINQTLESIAQTLFKSWFIDFDPVKAKMAGRVPKSMDADLLALFPDSFEDSELGPIPKGWEVASLKNLTAFQNGYAFKSKNWTEGSVPVVKIGNVKPMLVNVDACGRVKEDTLEGLEKFALSQGDILIGMTGYVGEVGIVPKRDIMPYINQRVGKIHPNKDEDYSFILTFCRTSLFKRTVESKASGSAQANVSGNDIQSVLLAIPPESIRKEFDSICRPLFKKILLNEEQANILSKIRDALLPKLLSGEISVANINSRK